MMMAWRAAKLATRVHLTGSSMLPVPDARCLSRLARAGLAMREVNETWCKRIFFLNSSGGATRNLPGFASYRRR